MTLQFTPPTLTLSPLPTTGSAHLTHAGHVILSSCSGPLDAPASRQNPEECTLEVNLREASGAGGPRERYIERLLHKTLRPLLDVRAYPRQQVQVTLQVLRTPRDEGSTTSVGQAESVVGVLPVMVNAAVTALLDAGVSMRGVAVAVSTVTPVVGDSDDEDEEMGEQGVKIVDDAKILEEVAAGAGIHAFAFTGKGEMLLAVSEGACEIDVWEEAASMARTVCCGSGRGDEGMIGWLRGEIAKDLSQRRRWKQGSEEG